MIPGLMHGLMGGKPPVTLDFLGLGASNSSAAADYPVSPQGGDIAVFIERYGTDTLTIPDVVVPSGYTQRGTVGNARTITGNDYSERVVVSTRICDGTEGASVSGQSATVNSKRLLLYRPSRPADVSGSTVDTFQATSSSTLPVSLAAPEVSPALVVTAHAHRSTTLSLTSSPSLVTYNANRFSGGYLLMQEHDDLSALSSALSSSNTFAMAAIAVALTFE